MGSCFGLVPKLEIMLRELIIKNFAIIDSSNLSFSEGLSVISGETGAGKSIIVNALNLVQGTRTSTDIIRSNEEEATVEALFDISDNNQILGRMDSLGVEREETLVIKRVVSHSGKNKVFVNGGLATLSMLSSIGEHLITISSQHENQSLLHKEKHIDVLDDFGDLLFLRKEVDTLFRKLVALSNELTVATTAADKRAERESLIGFQYNEIEAANLRVGEDKDLREQKNRLVNSERLLEYSNHGYNVIYGVKGSIIENLRMIHNNIREISKIDASLTAIFDGMESSMIELEDIALSLRDYARKIEFSPEKLEETELRLAEINKLKRKYGSTIEEILHYKDRKKKELEDISRSIDTLTHLKDEVHNVEKEILDLARDLSQKRKAVAKELKSNIEKELWSIGMEGAVFDVDIQEPRFSSKINLEEGIGIGVFRVTSKGIDDVEFLLSPNPGEHSKSLSKVASGGELSRIVLALKSILANAGGVETLIFDEVDAGIGGRVADIVGQKLKSTSRFHQVICITHLPQIARFADTHYSISKTLKDGRTFASVRRLNNKERVDEIARMLAGVEVTDKVKDHAREMIEKAGTY